MQEWVEWVCAGSVGQRARAAEEAEKGAGADPWVACAVGDLGAVEAAIAEDAAWVKRAGGPMGMVPLVAVTHSWLILEPGFETGLVACARALLAAGADRNATRLDPEWPGDLLSALYGAAGKTHHAGMTQLLLEAGANPNDGESLYHSVEAEDATCMQMLLDAGASVTGSNAIAHVLDYEKPEALQLLLERKKREVAADSSHLKADSHVLHHAISRARGIATVRELVDASGARGF